MQLVLTGILFLSLPVWNSGSGSEDNTVRQPLTLKAVLAISGAKEIMVAFFCYCALEQTAALWAASYLVLERGINPETAASYAGMFYMGITVGRFLNGFLAIKLSDNTLIRVGFGIIGLGIVLLFLPLGNACALTGLVIVGLGCAPIYPCIIHSTPEHFGVERSQALVGVQMASAYVGICLMPPLFGFLSGKMGLWLLPWYLLAILVLMAVMYSRMRRKTA